MELIKEVDKRIQSWVQKSVDAVHAYTGKDFYWQTRKALFIGVFWVPLISKFTHMVILEKSPEEVIIKGAIYAVCYLLVYLMYTKTILRQILQVARRYARSNTQGYCNPLKNEGVIAALKITATVIFLCVFPSYVYSDEHVGEQLFFACHLGLIMLSFYIISCDKYTGKRKKIGIKKRGVITNGLPA